MQATKTQQRTLKQLRIRYSKIADMQETVENIGGRLFVRFEFIYGFGRPDAERLTNCWFIGKRGGLEVIKHEFTSLGYKP